MADSLVRGLTECGYVVDWVLDGERAKKALENPLKQFQMALIDWELPRESASEVLRAIRRAGNDTPVLIIAACEALTDLVEGLDEGANDFLVKPFKLAEVKARLRALARRYAGHINEDPTTGFLTLHTAARKVSCGGHPVQLISREYAVLEILMRRPGALVSRAQLEAHLYGYSVSVESNAIEFLLHGLRQKIGSDQIENVRGMGWRVSVEPRGGGATTGE